MGQDMGVTCNPWIEAAVHGVEAHFIANKDKIQVDHFKSEDHVHSVMGQKMCSACGMLSQGVVMIHDNTCPHTAAAMQNLITTFGWEQFNHSPYSPDLAPSDFHLLLHLKSFLAGRRFHDDSEVKETVTMCFASQAASFYNEGVQKLVQRYDKCLNNSGNHVEK